MIQRHEMQLENKLDYNVITNAEKKNPRKKDKIETRINLNQRHCKNLKIAF